VKFVNHQSGENSSGSTGWLVRWRSARTGDFAVWSGNPLATSSLCLETWIDGKQYFEREGPAGPAEGEARNAERLRASFDKAKKLAEPNQPGDPARGEGRREKFFFRALEDREVYYRCTPAACLGSRDVAMEKTDLHLSCALVALRDGPPHAETLLLRGATVHNRGQRHAHSRRRVLRGAIEKDRRPVGGRGNR